MKKKLLILLASSMLLGACTQNTESSSSKEENSSISTNESSSQSSETSSSSETSTEESSESDSSSSEELHIDSKFVGRWYINSSNEGVLPINGIFDIYENDTLAIGQVTLTLKGHYDGFEETYKFVYGSISFIVSYDEDHDYLDYGYDNTNESDFGFASKNPVKDPSYDYYDSFPMEQAKEYLGTTLDLPALTFEANSYGIMLFTSSLYNVKCADIVCYGASTAKTANYLQALLDNEYTMTYTGGKISEQTFYSGWDKDKTYSVRIIYYPGDSKDLNEMHIFLYNYSEEITKGGN